MKKFFYHNGLSIVFLMLFFFGLAGQIIFGLQEYNKSLLEWGGQPIEWPAYLQSGHFIEATFENWESEFLQMAMFVWLTIFLKQKGSSESKKFDEFNEVDREPSASRKGAPWPVRKGGIWLNLYKSSLTISLLILFILSFVLHLYGSFKDANIQNLLEGKPPEMLSEFICDSRLWFESFQNWQSEFLSIFAIIILSIFLRQKGSTQSKPVDAPNSETD
ncbi:DUF6766 family protein [Chryseobacterium sp.]|uniref:DUF6766 family protein n=1 Tax=Chryseobacterium sp. TaxID=1871047 RepID=UPI0011CBA19D|nr:DUF6766 family protein [Chryseobacterium sp.]TXF77567.1 hypothetical protein FUA25_06470 [Chryseobacterium sp.]